MEGKQRSATHYPLLGELQRHANVLGASTTAAEKAFSVAFAVDSQVR